MRKAGSTFLMRLRSALTSGSEAGPDPWKVSEVGSSDAPSRS